MINRRNFNAGLIAASMPLAAFKEAIAATKKINLTIASSHPTVIPWVGPLQSVIVAKANSMLKERGSEYEIEWTEAYGGALYNFNDTLEAVTNNLTDIGWIGSLWEPSTLPLHNIYFSTPFTTTSPEQAVGIMNALDDSEKAMQDEWTKQDVISFGACVSGGYHLFTKKPINKLSDLEGMKILGAPTTAPYLTPFGATVVPSGLPAMYSQLETGVGDGVIIIHAGAFPLKLYEQAKHVTLVDTGPFTFGASGMNLDVFNSLPSEVQDVLKTLGREYSSANAGVINILGKKALGAYEAFGCTIREMPDSQRKDMANGMEDLGALFVQNLEPKGIPAGDILKKFMKLAAETGQPLRDWSSNI